ncbi:hypothetical protein PYW07_003220 [Mythimna separata]|uniref:Juvenile hormone binding protein n=1 Tax=Mythimna separata TaxID=271217 RepID=A0AAD7YJ91_MYTSE|nr:hypothetical protein PYW07_003220 [Mythimna separata]UXX34493.1 Juvenile hormone-binding protein 3 [Mythimna separata]
MVVCKSFLLLTFACFVLSVKGKYFDPCYKDDIKCLSKATEDFLEKTYNGVAETQIKPFDPLIIPELNVVVDQAMGLTFDFKNINITGLKNQQISDFQMDTSKKSVLLKTRAVLNIVADLKIKFTNKNKEFTGTYTASTTALGASQYSYTLTKKGDNEFFDVGPETNTCEIIGEPVVTISDNLASALENDSDAQAMKPDYEDNKTSLRKKTLCQIVETAYITVIHNIRAVAQIFPKSAFFIDI